MYFLIDNHWQTTSSTSPNLPQNVHEIQQLMLRPGLPGREHKGLPLHTAHICTAHIKRTTDFFKANRVCSECTHNTIRTILSLTDRTTC